MQNRFERDITEEINILEQEIKAQDQSAVFTSLVMQHHLYDKAQAACVAARALITDNNLSQPDKDQQYECVLEILKRIKKTVLLPSLQNATELEEYRNSICYSNNTCNIDKTNKFWGAVKVFAGAALYVAGIVACFLLPIIPPLNFIVGFSIMMTGGAIYKKGKVQMDTANENLATKTHIHLSPGDSCYEKNQTFLTKLSYFSDSAKRIGDIAENKFKEQETKGKNDVLNTFLRVMPAR